MDESQPKTHWPCVFWVTFGAMCLTLFFYKKEYKFLIQAVGFFCMAYSSFRLLPANLFTQHLSFQLFKKSAATTRRSDLVVLILGLVFVAISLVI